MRYIRSYRPQPILLANVITPGPEDLLPAQKYFVEQLHADQIAEKFPTCGGDEAGYPHGIGHDVQRRRGGHARPGAGRRSW